MKKILKICIAILIILLFIFYVGRDYDCANKCVLEYSGKFLAVFLIFLYPFIFVDKLRRKLFKLGTIYISTMFVLFSAVHYFDNLQLEQALKIQKDYMEIKIKYTSIDFKNVNKDAFDSELTKFFNNSNQLFDNYANKQINGYKEMIGRAMIALTLIFILIIALDSIELYFREKKSFDKD